MTAPCDICSLNYFAVICCNEGYCNWKGNYVWIKQKKNLECKLRIFFILISKLRGWNFRIAFPYVCVWCLITKVYCGKSCTCSILPLKCCSLQLEFGYGAVGTADSKIVLSVLFAKKPFKHQRDGFYALCTSVYFWQSHGMYG